MRKYIYIVLMVVVLGSCSKEKKATLSLELTHSNRTAAYLNEIWGSRTFTVDSGKVSKRGKIRFNIPLKNSKFYQLRFDDGKSVTFILSPGEHVKMTADYNDFYVSKEITGSGNSILVNELHDSLRATTVLLNAIRKEYVALQNEDNSPREELEKLDSVYSNIQKAYHRYSVGFLLENPSSLASIATLYQEYSPGVYVLNQAWDLQLFKNVSDSLSSKYPDVSQVKQLKKHTKKMISDYEMEKILSLANSVSSGLPEIALPDINGNQLKLSSLEGNIVLLAFWSVQQKNSIRNVIALNKTYMKYKSKGFEIYQVSVDNSFEAWKNALKFEEITWPSVRDTLYPNSPTRARYNVNELPMNYLLNKEQTEIIAKNVSPESLEKLLSRLLN